MLSGESANGDWPVLAVETMAKIAIEAERQLRYEIATSKAKSDIMQQLVLFQEHTMHHMN